MFCVHAKPLKPCCSQFITHVSQLLHVVSFWQFENGPQQDCTMHWSHFFVLVVPHETFAPHTPATHAAEQHSSGLPQLYPSGLHVGGGGGGTEPHTPFGWQYCEQHCIDDMQIAPSGLHEGTPP